MKLDSYFMNASVLMAISNNAIGDTYYYSTKRSMYNRESIHFGVIFKIENGTLFYSDVADVKEKEVGESRTIRIAFEEFVQIGVKFLAYYWPFYYDRSVEGVYRRDPSRQYGADVWFDHTYAGR